MKKLITDNFSLKLLSLLIAFVVWIIIVNTIDPIKTRTIKDIPVTVINAEVIENLEQCYEIISEKSVSVTVKGNKSIVDKLKASDFEAIADMELISVTNAVPVYVKLVKKVESEPDIIIGETNTIVVELDKEVTNSYEVNLNLTGTVSNDYYISSDEVKLSFSKIKISGPQQIVETIEKVQVDVDISEITEVSKAKYEIKAYDANGKKVASKRINFSKDYVDVTVSPLLLKTLAIKTKIKGEVGADYIYKGTKSEINSIKVAGTSDVISGLGDIVIEIDINEASGNIDNDYNLKDYLPENVKIVSDTSKVNIVTNIDELSTKRIQFKANTLKFLNVPNDVLTNYNMDEILTVSIKGEEKVIKDITIEQLAPHVDLEGLPMGEQNISVIFEEIEGVSITGRPTVVVNLTDKASIVEGNTTETPAAN